MDQSCNADPDLKLREQTRDPLFHLSDGLRRKIRRDIGKSMPNPPKRNSFDLRQLQRSLGDGWVVKPGPHRLFITVAIWQLRAKVETRQTCRLNHHPHARSHANSNTCRSCDSIRSRSSTLARSINSTKARCHTHAQVSRPSRDGQADGRTQAANGFGVCRNIVRKAKTRLMSRSILDWCGLCKPPRLS